jgi:hypothetical protein
MQGETMYDIYNPMIECKTVQHDETDVGDSATCNRPLGVGK